MIIKKYSKTHSFIFKINYRFILTSDLSFHIRFLGISFNIFRIIDFSVFHVKEYGIHSSFRILGLNIELNITKNQSKEEIIEAKKSQIKFLESHLKKMSQEIEIL